MIQELYARYPPLFPFKYKRYFESKHNNIRIFGLCEVTGKNFEMNIPAAGFFVYMQGFQPIDALTTASAEERSFILTGVSPEGGKLRNN